jgi:hypothetical protein
MKVTQTTGNSANKPLLSTRRSKGGKTLKVKLSQGAFDKLS